MKNFKNIKKHSESYAKMMRDYFPLSFEDEKLNSLLDTIVFNDEKSLFCSQLKKENKINDFKSFIFSLFDEEREGKRISSSVKELLDKVLYNFYHCKTEEDVLQFKKYYKSDELICTYNNIKGKLNNYHIFWIVKKDIDEIKRSSSPERQDLYGTSCCSIQINKNNNRDISIKNRYNHTVASCDATFSNNIDNIIEGLTDAFNNEFNLKTIKNNSFELENFIYKDDKFIYYNYEINNIYYGINKIYKDGELTIYNPNDYILIDYFLISIKEKRIIKIDDNLNDDFFKIKFNKIIIKKDKNNSFLSDEDKEDTLFIYK